MESVKISDNEIQISKAVETPAPVVVTYKYDYLIAQKANIITDANAYLAARKKELDEVEALLAECAKQGVTGQVFPEPIAIAPIEEVIL